MDEKQAGLEHAYATWQEAEHALDAHEDTAWHSTLRPDGTYMVHAGQAIDPQWLATEAHLRDARDAARTSFIERARQARGR